jgi:hypothetical protein
MAAEESVAIPPRAALCEAVGLLDDR